MKRLLQIENLANLVWIAFGLITGYDYYAREEYVRSGLFFFVAIIYTAKFIKEWSAKKDDKCEVE